MSSSTSTADFFSFLGLSRKLNIDTADLEQRYRTLSRQCHPDYFYNAPPAERRASLERSSHLNDAKRTEHEVQLQSLSAEWDAAVERGAADGDRRGILEALRDRLLERNYINNLLAGIERELAQ